MQNNQDTPEKKIFPAFGPNSFPSQIKFQIPFNQQHKQISMGAPQSFQPLNAEITNKIDFKTIQEKKIDQTLSCIYVGHETKKMIGVCLNKQCEKIGPYCQTCLQQFHSQHTNDLIELDEFHKKQSQAMLALEKTKDLFENLEMQIKKILDIIIVFPKNKPSNEYGTTEIKHISILLPWMEDFGSILWKNFEKPQNFLENLNQLISKAKTYESLIQISQGQLNPSFSANLQKPLQNFQFAQNPLVFQQKQIDSNKQKSNSSLSPPRQKQMDGQTFKINDQNSFKMPQNNMKPFFVNNNCQNTIQQNKNPKFYQTNNEPKFSNNYFQNAQQQNQFTNNSSQLQTEMKVIEKFYKEKLQEAETVKDELKNNILELKKVVEQQQNKLTDAERQIAKYKQYIEQKENELKYEVNNKQNLLVNAEGLINELKQEVEYNKQKLDDTESRIGDLEWEVEQKQNKLADAENRINILKNELASSEQKELRILQEVESKMEIEYSKVQKILEKSGKIQCFFVTDLLKY